MGSVDPMLIFLACREKYSLSTAIEEMFVLVSHLRTKRNNCTKSKNRTMDIISAPPYTNKKTHLNPTPSKPLIPRVILTIPFRFAPPALNSTPAAAPGYPHRSGRVASRRRPVQPRLACDGPDRARWGGRYIGW